MKKQTMNREAMRRREFVKRSGMLALASGLVAGSQPSGVQGRGVKPGAATGPLRVDPRNGRYFCDGNNRAIYLAGSHMWNNLVDMGQTDPPPKFDFGSYLDWLQRYGHNFIRLWTWENYRWDTSANRNWGKKKPHVVGPHPWARTGPGAALDGKPKYDLTKFDPEYFSRLKTRVQAAGDRGIYVSVMLFEGWAMQRMTDAFLSHPFHPRNNANGIDGDLNHDGKGFEVHTLKNPKIVALQEAYVKKVIATVGDLDNVLYEISNENHPASTKWQYHLIKLIKAVERGRAKQHPVGMTFQFRGGSNRTLFDSPADWISPNSEGGYQKDPPPADGRKVIINDTDHLWGIGGNRPWVWKNLTRGHNSIFMDPYDGSVLAGRFDRRWEPIRRALGATRRLADELNLAAMVPRGELASTHYCLADPGRDYVVYLPQGGQVTVDLSTAREPLTYQWINPDSGKTADGGETRPGSRNFTAPGKGDWALRIRARPT